MKKYMLLNQENGSMLQWLINILKHKRKRRITILVVLLFIWWFSIPNRLFNTPYSSILEGNNNELLAAKIANDGQWRFPLTDSVPYKFEQCITHFEDEYFRYHPGVNPVSIGRALYQNIKQGKVTSGGSTLSMQVIRLSRKNPSRSLIEKFTEIFRAVRMEVTYSKDEILSMYAAHAPFGGNVVGLETASWRYYGRPPSKLSWGEIATLAVLPNAPSLIYPGKNHEKLLKKRNRLLDKLKNKGIIDDFTCELAKEVPLPNKPKALPQTAIHLLERLIITEGSGKRFKSTINPSFQRRIEQISYDYQNHISENEIHNGAVIVADIETGEVITYIGNTNHTDNQHHKDVNIIHAPRSSGSILKPLLYINMINDGHLLPHMKLLDIPTTYGNYRPKNYTKSYEGLVDASEALARSLNVTAVRLLKRYGTENFLHQLQKMGIKSLNKSHQHYGLSLILGGGEVNLFEMTNIYTQLGQRIHSENTFPIHILKKDSTQSKSMNHLSPKAIYKTFEALLKLNRPQEEEGWNNYSGLSNVAWKTGTSFGHKDAWAIGVTGKYVIGVWIGNADGEGRPGITGVKAAAPLLFKIVRALPQSSWIIEPIGESIEASICSHSGYLAGIHCDETETSYLISNNSNLETCPYHKLIHLSENENYRVNMDCYNPEEIVSTSWFTLPPTAEWYYRKKNIHFKSLPPLHPDCHSNSNFENIDIIYPRNYSKLKIPRELTGKKGKIVLNAAHRSDSSSIHWHLNNEYIGTTVKSHQLAIQPKAGKYKLVLIDQEGNEKYIQFEIID